MGMKEVFTARQLAHRHDPVSAHRAAVHVVQSGKLEGQLKQVYDALKRHPQSTARELSKLTGIDYHMIAKRLPVLSKKTPAMAKVNCERLCRHDTTGIPVQEWSPCNG